MELLKEIKEHLEGRLRSLKEAFKILDDLKHPRNDDKEYIMEVMEAMEKAMETVEIVRPYKEKIRELESQMFRWFVVFLLTVLLAFIFMLVTFAFRVDIRQLKYQACKYKYGKYEVGKDNMGPVFQWVVPEWFETSTE